jgi:phosphopantothenoylcysteine decarboxylase/phosphopantothenate--cysteine ligase
MALKGKKIIVAVTGSIAAYKIPHFVRLLVKAGAEVQVLLTTAAKLFVSPLSLATVSGREALTDVTDGSTWNNHVALGLWADAMIVAPCSANTLGKLANGICDTIVAAVYLSARCPVFIAPAMDEDMWLHPSTQGNINRLGGYGNHIIPTEHGELASGLIGPGRMAEPENMIKILSIFWDATTLPLHGQVAVVTAGPTYERIDPVRFIGNFSTGKMGIAIAESLANAGASVTLILGPTQHKPSPNSLINVINVESAAQMYDATMTIAPQAHIAVLAAAVADYKPLEYAENKIKKQTDDLTISLTKTKDILASLGKIKQDNQTLIGFALETENEQENAHKKLEAKNADMIVLNSLRDEGAGFGHDTNKVTLLLKNGTSYPLPLLTKTEVATAITEHIILLRNEANNI